MHGTYTRDNACRFVKPTAMWIIGKPKNSSIIPTATCTKRFTKIRSQRCGNGCNPAIFCSAGGDLGHKPIVDAVADLNPIVVEPGIGYPRTFAPYRVFESYSKLHLVKGQIDERLKVYQEFKDTVPEIAAWDTSHLFPYTYHHWFDDVIPNYFDPDDFLIPVPNHDAREDFILFIGRLMKTKGLEVAMRLADKVGMPLYVAGQGDFKEGMGWTHTRV